MNMVRHGRRAAMAAIIGFLAGGPALAAQDPPPAKERDLTELSLEELSKLEVTSASRKEQRLVDVPAAIFVIRGEDIRRTGVRSIPEALRLAPGVQVSRIDGNKWNISIRGFSDRFGNKLQVLVDGRSVYSPLFSGVFWDVLDTNLEDVDRIEVIRGPGATAWGANAVNGVINIITKKARDTQGAQVSAGGGTEEKLFGSARVGGKAGDGLYYRAFAKYFDRDGGYQGNDDWHQARTGFRADVAASDIDTITGIGEFYQGQSGSRVSYSQPPPVFGVTSDNPYDVSGGFLAGRWDRRLSDTATLGVQLSYTYSQLEAGFFAERRHQVDLDVTHRFQALEGHDVVWGVGYRLMSDDIAERFTVSFDPASRTDDLVSVFLQDEIKLVQDVVWASVGVRLEHNDYTGIEVQPSVRLAVRPHSRHLLWASWSRATRTPSRAESDIRINAAVAPANPPGLPLPAYFAQFGADDLKSEVLNAFEVGYRVQPVDSVSLDVTGFVNRYHRLTSDAPGPVFPEPAGAPDHLVFAGYFDDRNRGNVYGVEAVAMWQVADPLRIQASYSFLRMQMPDQNGTERSNPRGQAVLRASLDITEQLALDGVGRWVSRTPSEGINRYFEADARLCWRPTSMLEISVVGQNLLHKHHFESNGSSQGEAPAGVDRGVYGEVTLKF